MSFIEAARDGSRCSTNHNNCKNCPLFLRRGTIHRLHDNNNLDSHDQRQSKRSLLLLLLLGQPNHRPLGPRTGPQTPRNVHRIHRTRRPPPPRLRSARQFRRRGPGGARLPHLPRPSRRRRRPHRQRRELLHRIRRRKGHPHRSPSRHANLGSGNRLDRLARRREIRQFQRWERVQSERRVAWRGDQRGECSQRVCGGGGRSGERGGGGR
mmetsp:Transcript_6939/g.13965  ORF Transcript_6939/g.13965 Transcript_6939/m.13965 type:complete len:210 (-) Transcript_6939:2265-2894(-)